MSGSTCTALSISDAAESYYRPRTILGAKAEVSMFRNHFVILIVVQVFQAVLPSTACSQQLFRTIQHDGLDRSYTIFVPDGYVAEADTPMPLVVNLHGLGSNPIEQAAVSQMHSIANRESFFVASPQAVNSDWSNGEDNVGFVGSVLDDVGDSYAIDSDRVYVMGLSQGGAMSYDLGATLTHRIAAIASVAGVPRVPVLPNRPMPLLHVHGTSDSIVPYLGGQNPFAPGPDFPAVRDVIDLWSTNNQCAGDPFTMELANTVINDNSTVTKIASGGCLTYMGRLGEVRHSDVIHYRVNQGGHNWPGSPIDWPPWAGTVNQDISASEVIWEFFQSHSLPSSVFGDFNGDGMLTVHDLDHLTSEIRAGATDERLDLNQSGTIDQDDRDYWVTNIQSTWIGDADLNGQVDSADLNALALSWRITNATSWAQGDFNGDGNVNAVDLNDLALHWRSGVAAPPAAPAVPESSSIALLLIGLAFSRSLGRRVGFSYSR